MADCEAWKIAAYLLVGFCILLDLRIGLNGSPFTIKRFRIPEHLFSLYVSRLNDGMEFSSAVGSGMGTALVLSLGKGNDDAKKYLAMLMNWLFWLSDMIFIVVYTTGGEYGYPTLFYWTLCFSSWTYGANQAFIFSMAGSCTVYYLSTVHASSIFTSVLHWFMLKLVGNRRKYNTDMIVMVVQIVASIFFTLASAAVFTYAHELPGGSKRDQAKKALEGLKTNVEKLENYLSGNSDGIDFTELKEKAGKTTPEPGTGLAGRAKALADKLGELEKGDGVCKKEGNEPDGSAQSKLETLAQKADDFKDARANEVQSKLGELKTPLNDAVTAMEGCGKLTESQYGDNLNELTKAANALNDACLNIVYKNQWLVSLSAMLMCITGLGVVYAFYPAIAPGMLVDFRYINRIDQAVLVLTPFPSIIIVVISAVDKTKTGSPSNKWEGGLEAYHGTHIFGIIMIVCGILFVISLHYPQSPVAKSIVNKPWTVAFLTIIYYASHLVLIGVGFPGVTMNCSPEHKVYTTTINNFFVRSSMIVFIYISEGYIQEFKHHDRFNWPTIGMNNRKAFGFWMHKAGKHAWKNLKMVFTLDLRRDLLMALESGDF